MPLPRSLQLNRNLVAAFVSVNLYCLFTYLLVGALLAWMTGLSSGWPDAAQGPKFKNFASSKLCPQTHAKFRRRRPSNLVALGFWKCWHRMVRHLTTFCRAMLHKRSLCHHGVSVVCACVCLSVCVCQSRSCIVKTNEDIFKFFSPSGSHTILVFPHQTGWQYSDGNMQVG